MLGHHNWVFLKVGVKAIMLPQLLLMTVACNSVAQAACVIEKIVCDSLH